jgi:prophage antirepressor-like protein
MDNQTKQGYKVLTVAVSDGLTVELQPSVEHGYLLTGRQVANGFGIEPNSLRFHKKTRKDELIEGKHWVVSNTHTPEGGSQKTTFWTKRGIIRLGFFIKSEQAKLFRNWAEDYIVQLPDEQIAVAIQPKTALPFEFTDRTYSERKGLDGIGQLEMGGDLWFSLADVCRAYDLGKPEHACKKLRKGLRIKVKTTVIKWFICPEALQILLDKKSNAKAAKPATLEMANELLQRMNEVMPGFAAAFTKNGKGGVSC